jgi:hypothetical protein
MAFWYSGLLASFHRLEGTGERRRSLMIDVLQTSPVLRIFDEAKAREFYLDGPASSLDFSHR